MNKLQKKILIALIILTLLTPAGLLLPMVFNAGDAWGEWSAETVKGILGYVPEGLQKYTDVYHAPLADYSINPNDTSTTHQSFYYIITGIIGAALTLGVTILISRLIIKK
ncbi:MAG: PDGLE domain-containing protein [Bacteroidota bacterium]